MKRLLPVLAATLIAAALGLHALAQLATGTAGPHANPKLLLAVVIDQFRYDYLQRFRKDYTGGFARAFEHGAVFVDAHHVHFPTVTAIGHSTFLTGATPAISGIVGNEWYDRETGKEVTSVSDDSTQLLGGAEGRIGSSPHRLLVDTVGDELKMEGKGGKVIGVSIKDRAAILPSGHMADGAYWFDASSGNWVSSTYYFKELPTWVRDYNRSRPADKYARAEWLPFDAKPGSGVTPYRRLPGVGATLYSGLEATPFGNDLIEQMAEHAVAAEQLGRHEGTDVLCVSFSSNDYVGHALGPDSPEVRDISIRTDRLLAKLMDYIDGRIGPHNTLFVLTADHGVTPVPEVNRARHMPGGRLSARKMIAAIQAALETKYGAGKWVLGTAGPIPYLNRDLVRERKLNEEEVENTAAAALREMPDIFRVYTRDDIIGGHVMEDFVSRAVRNGFNIERSGDIVAVPDPYWIVAEGTHGTSHGTPFNYDTHVPVIFMGAHIKPGTYYEHVAVNDIAPTLSALLQMNEPGGSVGRILGEMIQ